MRRQPDYEATYSNDEIARLFSPGEPDGEPIDGPTRLAINWRGDIGIERVLGQRRRAGVYIADRRDERGRRGGDGSEGDVVPGVLTKGARHGAAGI